jgi:hypothetical protein
MLLLSVNATFFMTGEEHPPKQCRIIQTGFTKLTAIENNSQGSFHIFFSGWREDELLQKSDDLEELCGTASVRKCDIRKISDNYIL